MAVTYNKHWFNPLYYHLEYYAKDPDIRHIFVYGGKSAAKTHSALQLFSIQTLAKGFSCMVYRKELARVKDSVKQTNSKILKSCGIKNAFDNMEFEMRCKMHAKGEASIRMRGFEDEDSVKGIEGYKWLLFDELDHFEKKELTQANASLRGTPDQKIFATWNPVSEHHWIKTEWIDTKTWVDLPLNIYEPGHPLYNVAQLSEHSNVQISEDGRSLLIKTNFYDNKWIQGGNDNGVIYGEVDKNLILEYEDLKYLDPEFYEVNVIGNWGRILAKRPFVRNLNYKVQVGSCYHLYNRNLPVNIALDFNEKWTATVGQTQGDRVLILKSFHDEPEKLLQDLATEFGHWECNFTGDFSGNSSTQYTSNESKKTAWKLCKTIFNELCATLYDRDLQMQIDVFTDFRSVPQNGNIGHSNSRTIMGALLFYWGVKFMIDKEQCKKLIKDCEIIEANEQGGLDKEKLNRLGIGHWLDTLRYYFSYFHYSDFKVISKTLTQYLEQ